ncbi:hypothetical protein [Asticcacaulis sp.]|uniref:hypothetical protein n=1 Tax=Asticcacaulis sp. TaxID=1872648 RepID=UPI003F7C085F
MNRRKLLELESLKSILKAGCRPDIRRISQLQNSLKISVDTERTLPLEAPLLLRELSGFRGVSGLVFVFKTF